MHIGPSEALDNDQDVIDLMVADITGLTAYTGLVDRRQLVPASIWRLSVAIPAGSFLQVSPYPPGSRVVELIPALVVPQYQPTGVTIRGTPATRGQDGVTKIPELPDETRMLIHRDDD
ncbi:hypothetical protein FCIRC_1739 [Fusarium circinatum]|uniref:Uncharacterized protein n=1 Tax=Fusarium circinatum TaxID=48490 RepID=A0A8H5XBJ6_FUSCI|nr:hypothetical protein FCIRC_1739 [Fusarium circinatum]